LNTPAPPALEPDVRDLLALLATIYMENDRPEKAAVLLSALDALQQTDSRALAQLALAQLRSGKPDKALGTLDRLAIDGRADAVFHLIRAHTLLALQREDEAAAAMRAYVALRPAGADAAPGGSSAAA